MLETYKKATETIVKDIVVMIARFGVAKAIWSDNGPCFFVVRHLGGLQKDWKIDHITSSLNYQESNRLTERSVGTIKWVWKKKVNKNGLSRFTESFI